MVRHLQQKVREIERLAELKPGDTVLDIGSNDATCPQGLQCAGPASHRHRPDRSEVPPLLSGRYRAGPGFLFRGAFRRASTRRQT